MENIKTLYMETTKKEPEETSSEIEVKLKNYELTKYMKDYQNGEVVGCIFSIRIGEKEVPIKLPIRWEPLLEKANRGETRYIKPGDKDQARRVAWRQVLRWIESQLALVDLEMVEIAEVFLAYMMVDKKRTLYQHLIANDMKLIESDTEQIE
jgi:hypothetical protein